MKPFHSLILSNCAEILSGELPVDRYPEAKQLLADLGYVPNPNSPSCVATDDHRNHIQLLRAAAKMDLFGLDVPDAPRMNFIGGRVIADRFDDYKGHLSSSASGISMQFSEAFESCVGEGVEYLSQLSCNESSKFSLKTICQDEISTGQIDWSCYYKVENCADSMLDKVIGIDLSKNAEVQVPECLCIRAANSVVEHGFGTGCAAGRTISEATKFAVLELIERDAAALWWEGGRSPRPVSNEWIISAGLHSLYSAAGRTLGDKISLVLDITTDVGVPTIAAISADASDGGRLSCGLSARFDYISALRKAVHEMMQMELAHHLIEIKQRMQGHGSLNEHDREHLRREKQLRRIWTTKIIQPVGRPVNIRDFRFYSDEKFTDFIRHLSDRSFDVIMVNLTRKSLGIPVVKAFIPKLQTYPMLSSTERLKQEIYKNGEGYTQSGGVSLL